MSRGEGNGAGRPKIYSKELASKVCEAISTSSCSLEDICKMEGMPSVRCVHRWRIDEPEFDQMYTAAKRNQIEVFIDEMITISDDSSHDTKEVEDKNGYVREVCDTEWIARSKLRVDSRKWLASRLCPKLYGDKVTNETKITITHEEALKELE